MRVPRIITAAAVLLLLYVVAGQLSKYGNRALDTLTQYDLPTATLADYSATASPIDLWPCVDPEQIDRVWRYYAEGVHRMKVRGGYLYRYTPHDGRGMVFAALPCYAALEGSNTGR